jgi:predicted PurR-regulated permease PerM
VTDNQKTLFSRDRDTAPFIEIAIRLAALALLLYWSLILVRPFVSIAIWSVVLTVALYPCSNGQRFDLADAVDWQRSSSPIELAGCHWTRDVARIGAGRQSANDFRATRPLDPDDTATITNGEKLPLIGDSILQFWDLASTNLRAALGKIIPQLKPLGSSLLRVGADTGLGLIKFLVSIIVAGFLFSPAPMLVDAVKQFHGGSTQRG